MTGLLFCLAACVLFAASVIGTRRHARKEQEHASVASTSTAEEDAAVDAFILKMKTDEISPSDPLLNFHYKPDRDRLH